MEHSKNSSWCDSSLNIMGKCCVPISYGEATTPAGVNNTCVSVPFRAIFHARSPPNFTDNITRSEITAKSPVIHTARISAYRNNVCPIYFPGVVWKLDWGLGWGRGLGCHQLAQEAKVITRHLYLVRNNWFYCSRWALLCACSPVINTRLALALVSLFDAPVESPYFRFLQPTCSSEFDRRTSDLST